MASRSFRAVVAFSLLAALIGSPAAGAQRQRSSVLSVSARVSKKCAVSTTPLRFGEGSTSINAEQGAEAIGTVAFDCTRGIRAELALDPGQNSLGGQRRLASTSGEYLEYELYQDSPLTRPWVAGTTVAVYVVATPENDDDYPEVAAARPLGTSAGGLLGTLLSTFIYEPPVPIPVAASRAAPLAPNPDAVSRAAAPAFAVGVVVYGRVAGEQEQRRGDFRDVVRATVVF